MRGSGDKGFPKLSVPKRCTRIPRQHPLPKVPGNSAHPQSKEADRTADELRGSLTARFTLRPALPPPNHEPPRQHSASSSLLLTVKRGRHKRYVLAHPGSSSKILHSTRVVIVKALNQQALVYNSSRRLWFPFSRV